jgi:hypothetical protein
MERDWRHAAMSTTDPGLIAPQNGYQVKDAHNQRDGIQRAW